MSLAGSSRPLHAARFAMPRKGTLSLAMGQRVGGVSERPTRETGGAILSRARGRNGGRHPGSRGAGSLRGLTEERGSRSVRLDCSGARSHAGDRTGDNRCPLEQGGGERRQRAHRRTHSKWWTPNKRLHARGHVLRSVQRPVHVYPHSTRGAQALRGGAVASISRSGKPAQAGGTGTGVGANGRMRGSPRITALQATAGVVRDA